MNDWTGAELRARLAHLGLSIPAFATRTGIDQRYVERVSTGKIGSVSERIHDAVTTLEGLANTELKAWDEATEDGLPISIPRLNEPQEPGDLPPHWYLALAGRLIAKRGTDAQIEWQ